MTISRRSLADVGLLVLVNAMWAAQYAAYKTASGQMGPVTVSAWTFLIAALILLPFLLWERRSSNPASAKPLSDCPSHATGHRANFVMIAVLGLVPASALLAWGTALSTASNAALLYLTIPIITALMATAMLNERMTPMRWLSLLVSLAGVLVISDFDWRQMGSRNSRLLLGNGLVLLACGSSAFYNVYSKKLLRRFTPLEVLIYGYLVAVVVSLPLLIWVEPLTLAQVRNYTGPVWISVLVLSAVSWGLAMVLWMFLLRRLDVSQISVSVYLLPFLGVLMSAVTLHEKITATMVVGGMITLAGTVLITATEPSN